MNKTSTFLLFFLCATLLTSCKNDKKKSTTSELDEISENEIIPERRQFDYEIVNTDVVETKNKAQVTKYVAYKDSIYNKDALSDVMLEVYFRNRKAQVFKNFEEPTVVAVYVFTSIEQAKNDRSSWISMLVKGPNDESPNLTYNEMKLKSLSGLNDEVKSKDEIALENLNEYLEKRDVTLCDLYKQFGSYELDNIRKADVKFPDYGKEHTDYVTKLNKADRNRIMSKYNLTDSIYTKTIVFGMSYCK